MNYIKNYQKINLQRNQDFLLFLKSLQNDSHKIARKTFLMEHFKKMPLEDKIRIAIARIEEFIEKCKESNKTPVISFSGGKDSCVLRHLVQKVDPTIKCETATELFHPEIAKFLKTIPDTTIYKSTLSFNEVIKSYGYPILSKEVAQRINNVRTSKTLGKWTLACFGLRNSRPIPKKFLHFLDETFVQYLISSKCCNLIKGAVKNNKNPKFLGTTIVESQLRKTSWIKHGCNFYSNVSWKSRPISIWTEQDIWDYIHLNKLEYSNAYKLGWVRTGCIACGFGMNFEQKSAIKCNTLSRFELLYKCYPNIYKKYVYEYKMYKPLADAGIELRIDDLRYERYFKKRKKMIEEWYSEKNFKKNLLTIIKQIEKRTNKNFSNSTINKIFKKYKVNK